ncbi:MAG TPA: hypothetical protein CFH79_06700 [Sulfurospirillum sp. UBA11407]|jgi:hypothetical protein|nr:MAG TPA: hypothetical protein CFH79_06700 [Sulfurospirillum sp. UBA11407]
MKANIGKMDRFVRVIVSVPFLVYGIMEGSIIPLVIGIVILGTAVLGFCGLYTLLGIDTCKNKDKQGNCEI